MTISITDERHGDLVVSRLEGRLDTVTSKTLEDCYAGHVAQGRRKLIADLSKIDYISSYGLRVFLMTAKKLRGPGDVFVLCDVQPSVLKIFEISGFDKILTIRGSLAECLTHHEQAGA